MRTTLDLPEDLVAEAQALLRLKSKTDVVIFSLRELLRRQKLEELKALAGRVNITLDIGKSRRRPRKAKR